MIHALLIGFGILVGFLVVATFAACIIQGRNPERDEGMDAMATGSDFQSGVDD